MVVSHGDPLRIGKEILDGKEITNGSNYPKNAIPEVHYIMVDSIKALNLHRPYIDAILLAPKNARKAKKVLGIHGFTANIENNAFWKEMKSSLLSG